MLDPLLNIAIFIVWWWMALLALLPVGVRRVEQGDVDLGHDAGAPQKPFMLKKAFWAAGVAAVLWTLTAIVIWFDPFHIRD